MSVRKKEAGAARLDCIRNKKIGHSVQQGLTVEVARERRERENGSRVTVNGMSRGMVQSDDWRGGSKEAQGRPRMMERCTYTVEELD